MNCSSECYCLHSTGRNWDCMHKTITTFSILSLAHHTSRAMELVNNDFSHKYVASSVRSERNGSITRKNQWLKLLSSLSTHFLQCFQLFLCTVRRAAIYNPWTRPLHPLHTLQHSKSAYTGSLHIHCVLYYLCSYTYYLVVLGFVVVKPSVRYSRLVRSWYCCSYTYYLVVLGFVVVNLLSVRYAIG